MFVGVLLRIVYYEDLRGWVARYFMSCHKNHWPVITNECFKFNELNFDEETRKRMEVEDFSENKLENAEIYYLPDSFYLNTEERYRSETDFFLELFEKRNEKFEAFFLKTLDEIESSHQERIEGLLIFGQGYVSLNYIAKERGYRTIHCEVSTVRVFDGYTQDLLWANTQGKLYHTEECKRRYAKFLEENRKLPMFSREELAALFGKAETLSMIPLMKAEPSYEMGICEPAYHLDPHIFVEERCTADDLLFESARSFSHSQIICRKHPKNFSETEYWENRVNPENFVLSCRRICTISSNTMVVGMLWNRTVCSKEELLSCAFMAEKDFSSCKVVDEKFLNYLLFAYLLPGFETLFNQEYWKFRAGNPTESELYLRHMKQCLQNLGLDNGVLNLEGEARLSYLLRHRGLNEYQIADILAPIGTEKVNFLLAVSCLWVNGEPMYCRNHFQKEMIVSEWVFAVGDEMQALDLELELLGDIAGYMEYIRVAVSGVQDELYLEDVDTEWRFWNVNSRKNYKLHAKGDIHVRVEWSYVNVASFSKMDKFYLTFDNIKRDSKILLYAAGNVGRSYYKQIISSKYCQLAAWVDKNRHGSFYMSQEILPIEAVKTISCDKLLIAVEDEHVAGEIRKELVAMGVETEKILWQKPEKWG